MHILDFILTWRFVDIVSQVDRTEARVHIVLLFVVDVVVPDFPIRVLFMEQVMTSYIQL